MNDKFTIFGGVDFLKLTDKHTLWRQANRTARKRSLAALLGTRPVGRLQSQTDRNQFNTVQIDCNIIRLRQSDVKLSGWQANKTARKRSLAALLGNTRRGLVEWRAWVRVRDI